MAQGKSVIEGPARAGPLPAPAQIAQSGKKGADQVFSSTKLSGREAAGPGSFVMQIGFPRKDDRRQGKEEGVSHRPRGDACSNDCQLTTQYRGWRKLTSRQDKP